VKKHVFKKQKPKPWVDPPPHPALEKIPVMSEAEIKEMAKDIEANGLQTPIEIFVDDSKNREASEDDFPQALLAGTGEFPQCLLLGRNRLAALKLLGISDPRQAPYSSSHGKQTVRYIRASENPGFDCEKYILSSDVYRRHLTSEQKREAIAVFIEADPKASNREVRVSARCHFLLNITVP
jgi:hypothetical protein